MGTNTVTEYSHQADAADINNLKGMDQGLADCSPGCGLNLCYQLCE